ncbi:MAG TPA: glycosyltransferase family 39 protein [bacterium]|nr:glycosyltransferase family 39 protein [bacterium]
MLESRHFPIFVFLLALVARIIFAFLFPSLPYNVDAAEYVILGQNIAHGHGYCYQPGHPTAYRLPLYPIFLAVFFAIFGGNCYWPISIGEAVIGSLCVVVLYYTALHIIGRNRPAAIVATMLAVYPPLVGLTNTFMTENLFSLLATLSALLLLRALTDPPSKVSAVLAGAVIGLSWLCRPTLFPLVAVLPLWALLAKGQRWGDRKARLKRTGLVLGIACLCLVPWAIRNAITMRAFIPFDTHGGATLWYQHNSLSPDGYFWSAIPKEKLVEIKLRINEQKSRLNSGESVTDVMLPVVLKGPMAGFEFLPKSKTAEFEGLTEVELDKAFLSAAVRTILSHPARYAKKSFKESVKFWHVFDDSGHFIASYAFVLPFAILGFLMFLSKRRWSETLLYLSPLLCAWLLAATINASHRFRLPFEPLALTFTGVFAQRFARLSSGARTAIIVAASTYAALVFCFFLYPEALRDLVQAIATRLGFSAYPVY